MYIYKYIYIYIYIYISSGQSPNTRHRANVSLVALDPQPWSPGHPGPRPGLDRTGVQDCFSIWIGQGSEWKCGYLINVLCLIIYIVRTSFGGDSYRVFLFWVPWEVFHTVLCLLLDSVRYTNRSQNL